MSSYTLFATMPSKAVRHRGPYVSVLLLSFLAGLSTHFLAPRLPRVVADYAPDTLWALWVFLVLVCLLPRLATQSAVLYALAFAYLMEATQLYHAPWLDHLRETTVGHLIFGNTFVWVDLLCYTVGIGCGALLDCYWHQRITIQDRSRGHR